MGFVEEWVGEGAGARCRWCDRPITAENEGRVSGTKRRTLPNGDENVEKLYECKNYHTCMDSGVAKKNNEFY